MPSNHRSCCSSGRIERSEIGDRKGALYREFFRHVTEPDLRLRFFAPEHSPAVQRHDLRAAKPRTGGVKMGFGAIRKIPFVTNIVSGPLR
jgi:hypothetical protein